MVESAGTATQPAIPETKVETKPAPPEFEQLIFTTRPRTGEIVKVEKITASGVRRGLSAEESQQIAGNQDAEDVDSMLDSAFDLEDAMADVLADEDFLERLIALRLLTRRIGRGVRALRRTMLRRLILRRLIRAANVM